MIKLSFGALGAICLAPLAGLLPTPSLADGRCQQLEALHAQYAGAALTSEQKQLKRTLVAWYYSHCHGHNMAGAD